MKLTSYRDLQVWQRGMDIVDAVLDLSELLPREERFELASQLRRAAVSVPSNIAEGRARSTTKEFIKHLSIACGSLAEVETLLAVAQRRRFMTEQQVKDILENCAILMRQLNALRNSLRRRLASPAPSPQPPAPPC